MDKLISCFPSNSLRADVRFIVASRQVHNAAYVGGFTRHVKNKFKSGYNEKKPLVVPLYLITFTHTGNLVTRTDEVNIQHVFATSHKHLIVGIEDDDGDMGEAGESSVQAQLSDAISGWVL